MLKAYKYNATTKIYEREVNRQLDQLGSIKAGHNVWLMPANATDVPPLEAKDGFNVVWNGSVWEYQKIPQPDPEPTPPAPTYDEIKQMRASAYQAEVDPITSHISRLRDKEQTPEIVAEIEQLIAERDAKVEEIKQRYPYPTDPVTESEENADTQD